MSDYVIRIHANPLEISSAAWNALLAQSDAPTPFMRHEYLAALHESSSAVEETGWKPQFIALYSKEDNELLAACPLYVKNHSYGEYVFDWAWARAYQEHGLQYYPKAVVAVPFTPVPGSRFLCRNDELRPQIMREALLFCEQLKLSSLHVLFNSKADLEANHGLMQRETVQFHWTNAGYQDFDDYLQSLTQEKRKKIRAERRKVKESGIVWRVLQGSEIQSSDWDFFYACYERTYLEHGNLPYLTRAFFAQMQKNMPENWVLFIAERESAKLACSLIAINNIASCAYSASEKHQNTSEKQAKNLEKPLKTAYGRYWGALERVDSLHFEACYYQPLEWCIQQGFERFEGGAQGEHKMARGLLPVATHSLHWLAQPQFAQAVGRFLQHEGAGVQQYLTALSLRSPFATKDS